MPDVEDEGRRYQLEAVLESARSSAGLTQRGDLARLAADEHAEAAAGHYGVAADWLNDQAVRHEGMEMAKAASAVSLALTALADSYERRARAR